jgi:hypothetical protein
MMQFIGYQIQKGTVTKNKVTAPSFLGRLDYDHDHFHGKDEVAGYS